MENLVLRTQNSWLMQRKRKRRYLNLKIFLAAFFLGDSKEMQLPAWEP